MLRARWLLVSREESTVSFNFHISSNYISNWSLCRWCIYCSYTFIRPISVFWINMLPWEAPNLDLFDLGQKKTPTTTTKKPDLVECGFYIIIVLFFINIWICGARFYQRATWLQSNALGRGRGNMAAWPRCAQCRVWLCDLSSFHRGVAVTWLCRVSRYAFIPLGEWNK